MIDVSTCLKWESTRKGVRIASCLKTAQGALDIPPTLDGKPVCEIGDGAFSGCSGLTSVVLPPSIQTLGRRAFQQCRALESVQLPPTLVEIPSCAFKNCPKLTEILLPESLLGIGSEAFSRCHTMCHPLWSHFRRNMVSHRI